MITDIQQRRPLVQKAFADHLHDHLGWESIYAYNTETSSAGDTGSEQRARGGPGPGPQGSLARLNPDMPASAREQAVEKLTRMDFARRYCSTTGSSTGFIRDGRARRMAMDRVNAPCPRPRHRLAMARERTANPTTALAVRELKSGPAGAPLQHPRPDLVCFVNGLPWCSSNSRGLQETSGPDSTITFPGIWTPTSFRTPSTTMPFSSSATAIKPATGQSRASGNISVEWKRNTEKDKGRVDAEALSTDADQERLLDLIENFILFDDKPGGGTPAKIFVRAQSSGPGGEHAVAPSSGQES